MPLDPHLCGPPCEMPVGPAMCIKLHLVTPMYNPHTHSNILVFTGTKDRYRYRHKSKSDTKCEWWHKWERVPKNPLLLRKTEQTYQEREIQQRSYIVSPLCGDWRNWMTLHNEPQEHYIFTSFQRDSIDVQLTLLTQTTKNQCNPQTHCRKNKILTYLLAVNGHRGSGLALSLCWSKVCEPITTSLFSFRLSSFI